ncbi:hypothetical protein IBX73_08390 [candidate division WOR-3 bacterium]|nr:hypothetical protein [candidate division WOR-3 bacterium]
MKKITKELIEKFYRLLSPCRVCPRELRALEQFGLDEGFRQTIDTIFRIAVPEWTDDLKKMVDG